MRPPEAGMSPEGMLADVPAKKPASRTRRKPSTQEQINVRETLAHALKRDSVS